MAEGAAEEERLSARWLSSALVVLLGAGAHAQEYLRTRVPGSDLCLTWQTRELTWHADAAGSARTPGESERLAIEAAFANWQATSDGCSDLRFLPGPLLVDASVGGALDVPNQHVIVFRETSCHTVVPQGDGCFADGTCANLYRCWEGSELTLALTTTTFNYRTGALADADVELNAASFLFTTVDAPPCEAGAQSPQCVAIDVQNTLTHEIGHIIGLDHVALAGSTMEASAPVGETGKRVIDPGTAAGLCDIYPRALPARSCEETDQLQHSVVVRRQPQGCGCAAAGALLPWGTVLLLCVGASERRRNG
ncbi:MAG: myxosortase-dependent metalloprotease, MXAN_2677/MXAN_2678 family [Myxococcota bacterium]